MSTFTTGEKSSWKWTMMIMHPSFVTPKIIDNAIAEVERKKNPKAISKLRFEAFSEGRCAQILHIGPFSEEAPTIQKVHQFVDSINKRGSITKFT